MTLWVILTILSAIFGALAVTTDKKILFKEHAMEFATIIAIFNVLLSIPLFFLIDYSTLPIQPIIYLFFVAPLGATAFLLMMKVIRHEEISTAGPISMLKPAVVAIFAFLILRESLSLTQFGGLILIVFGAYTLGNHKNKHFTDPFKILKNKKISIYIILAIIIYGLTAVFDRFVLTTYPIAPLAYLSFAQLFVAIDFIILITIFHGGIKDIKKGTLKFGYWIFLASILTVVCRLFHVYAVSMANVGLVVSLREISVLFTILLGGELFHEKNIKKKIISSLIMITGVTLIAL
ncbi:hypothetical protein COU54_00405 [Candidatus Pacearchaeota archaeon CG10_big_fil_rev_8_21_14_0_10_31_24]|nr:MAG: hypothetical protein COU54_00405 [Candidatus Pacearchaeota archaeon CG10_big_fil_rev_8_21_14_0_10_31_24]